MSLFVLPRQYTADQNGEPRVGAFASFYAAGTATPITTYTTKDYTIAHANPVVSLGGGLFPAIYINPAVNATYKVVITDVDGVSVFSEDDVPTENSTLRSDLASTIAAADGSRLVGFRRTDSGSPARSVYAKLEELRSPGDFAALGDAVTDDAAALQRFIDSCAAAGVECDLWGTSSVGYRIDTPLVISSPMKIRGHGFARCGIVTHGCNAFNVALNTQYVEFEGFRLNSAVRYTDASNAFKGINIQGTTAVASQKHFYSNLFIDGFETAIQANGVRECRFDNVHSAFGKNGIVALEHTVNNMVTRCHFVGDSTGSAVQVGDGAAASEGWIIAKNLFFGFGRGLWAYGSNNSKFYANFVDNFREYGVIVQSGGAIAATDWLIAMNYLAGDGGVGASSGIRLLSGILSSSSRGNRIIGNEVLKYGGTLPYGILVDGTQEKNNRIALNAFAGDTTDCSIGAGTGHIISGNNFENTGFATAVMVTYEGNEGPNGSAVLCRQANGSKFIYHVAGAAPAVAGVQYNRGDLAYEINLAAASTPGYGCITSGVAGASVWKAMANLAA